ncbi:hypothetical protein [Sphingobium sp. Sx8-8]|uniref:hypothetical protein n=1 Tax=Sphingobium sp. Sx8-8 TaxID=2933617 RepID=UPI001F586831|nr:hypothetical protein [Sphingobium sp. Sx8-8]
MNTLRYAAAALLMSTGLTSAGIAAGSKAEAASVLGTPGQIAAERIAVRLLADPEIKAIQAAVRAELAATPVGQTPEGAARLDHAIEQWTSSFIIKEIAGDPGAPQILWYDDNTPHDWHGHSIGMAVAGDNPDHIYRITTIDGSGRYEINGQVDQAHRPAQFSFESVRTNAALRQNKSSADMGSQIRMLTDQGVQVAPDGSFRLTVGGPDDGSNHLRTEPGRIGISVRDVLSDWTQKPNRLTIRRLDKPETAPRDAATLRRDILAGLPAYLRFWAHFKDNWFGGMQANVPVGPVPRDGNWGYLAAARYVLAPGEAVVIRTSRGGARYTGIQAVDAWMIAPDSREHQASVNLSQAKADPDGGYTYVLSPTDPGVPNWVDTGGLHQGYVQLRWQGFDSAGTGDGLLRGYKVVKLNQLKAEIAPDTPPVSPAQRAADIQARARAYRNRLD